MSDMGLKQVRIMHQPFVGGSMTPELIELARQLVAWEGWEWREGMLARLDRESGSPVAYVRITSHPRLFQRPWYPVLTDEATGGVLLGMLFAKARAESGLVEYTATLDAEESPAEVYLYPNERRYTASTLAAACAKALLGET